VALVFDDGDSDVADTASMTASDPIADYLARFDELLHVQKSQRQRIVDEARDHLEDAAARWRDQGSTPIDAARHAVADFGRAEHLAKEFSARAATTALHRSVLGAGALGVVIACGFIVAAVPQPVPRGQRTVPVVALVPLHLGVVAFQIAAASGLIVALTMAARWRAPALSLQDRTLLRRSISICVVSLGVTAIAWSVSLVVRNFVQGSGRVGFLAGGIVVMLLATATADVMRRRLARLPRDESDTPGLARSTGLMGVGEHALDWVRRRPRLSCLSVALVAGAGAMMRSETTVPVALGWGAGEAACVLAAFLTLGPTLGLRIRSRPAHESPTAA
jgi:hypothetical protein